MKIVPYIPIYDGVENTAEDHLTIYNIDVQLNDDPDDFIESIKTEEIHKSTTDTPTFESFLHILGNKYKKPVSKINQNYNLKSEKESREEESISLKISPTHFPDFPHNSEKLNDKIITGSDKNINQNQMAPHKNHHDKHTSFSDSSLQNNLEVPDIQKTDRTDDPMTTRNYHWYSDQKVPVINQLPDNYHFDEPEDLYFIKAVLIFCTSFLIFFICSQLFLCGISLLSRINLFIRKCFFGEDGGDNKSGRTRLVSSV